MIRRPLKIKPSKSHTFERMKKRFLIFGCCWPVLIAFSFVTLQAQTGAALLNKAYQQKSNVLLLRFLNEWASASVPKKATAPVLNAMDREVMDLFRAFYHPDDISPLGGYGGVSANRKPLYLVIQKNLDYAVVDSLPEWRPDMEYPELHGWDDSLYSERHVFRTIQPFRPTIDLASAKLLSLTPGYRKIMDDFLAKDNKVKPGEYMGVNTSEMGPRAGFLARHLHLYRTHWGRGWLYASYPFTKRILINRAGNRAVMNYVLNSRSGIAFFHKPEGKWELFFGRITITQ